MKKLLKIFTAIFSLLLGSHLLAQEAEKPEPSITIQYFNQNGSLQFLKVKAMVKEDDRFKPLSFADIQLYLDENAAENLIAKVKTDEDGFAKAIIPPALQNKWSESVTHKFIGVYDGSKQCAATTSETEIGKLKIVLDTLNEEGARKVTAQVLAFDSTWQPVKDVELKLCVRRMGGDLNIGEEETFTTDSLGQAIGEFKLDKLPAIDVKNNLVLVAKIEENESYGNVSFEKSVPWGLYTRTESNFGKRSLWATRDKAPIWLMAMAFSIMLAVWGVLVYLVIQIRKIKVLGKKIPLIKETAKKIKEPIGV